MDGKKRDPFIELMSLVYPGDRIIVHPANLFKGRNVFNTFEDTNDVEKNLNILVSLMDDEMGTARFNFLTFQDKIQSLAIYPYFKHAIDAFVEEVTVIENVVANRNDPVSHDELLGPNYNIKEYELRRRIFATFIHKYSK